MPSPLRVSSLAPRRNGDLSCFEEVEQTEAQKRYEQERAGGNYGTGTREIQTRNYIAAKEAARKRQEMFNDALEDFRAGKVEDALQVLLLLLSKFLSMYSSGCAARAVLTYPASLICQALLLSNAPAPMIVSLPTRRWTGNAVHARGHSLCGALLCC